VALREAWILPWAGLAALAIAVLVWWALRRRHPPAALPLANTDLLTSLPEYVHALWRHRLTTVMYAAAAAVVAVLALIGAARPVATTVINPEKANRDIVLCLDVSGSMTDADAEVASTFRTLAREFKGERLSLVIFNSSAVPVFPLTDDYAFVEEQLRDAQRVFEGSFDIEFYAGTLNGQGSSLIGDGLATCVRSFDHGDLTRARSIILATDNLAAGKSIFTLPEGGALAKAAGIQIYGLNPAHRAGSSAATEMRSVSEGSGGLYYPLNSTDAVSRIVSAVSAREASRIPGAPITLVHDQPASWVGWTWLGVLGLLGAVRRWRR
jgi:hypothetical protein